MIRLWTATYAIASFFDWLTTQLIINDPLVHESNPIMALVVYDPIMLFVVKFGVTGLCILAMLVVDHIVKYYDVPYKFEAFATAVVFTGAVMYIYIVYNNVGIMMLISG